MSKKLSPADWLFKNAPVDVLDYVVELVEASRPVEGGEKSLVNWNEVPDWAQWAAQDRNGYIFIFENKPDRGENVWFESNKDDNRWNYIDFSGRENLNWRNTLEKRP